MSAKAGTSRASGSSWRTFSTIYVNRGAAMGVKRYKTSQGWRWKNSFKQGGVKHRKQGFPTRAEAVEWEVEERERRDIAGTE
jgi:hypothetical protein